MRTTLLALLAVTFIACGDDAANDAGTTADSGAASSTAPADTATSQTEGTASDSVTTDVAASSKLNINTATEEQFKAAIPNLGDKMIHEFEEYRPYRSIQQFRKEIGKYVDEAKVAEYERYVFVPIDPNESDAATLQQIPGLAADEAEQIVGGRPFASQDKFFEVLAGFVSEPELATARTYVTAQ